MGIHIVATAPKASKLLFIGGSMAFGVCTTKRLSTLRRSKMENFENKIKHVLDPFCVFFTLFGCLGGGGVPRGLGHNLLMQFSNLGSSKVEISETIFF